MALYAILKITVLLLKALLHRELRLRKLVEVKCIQVAQSSSLQKVVFSFLLDILLYVNS